VFSRHYRKVKAIFGATDVLLTSIAFIAAYQTRVRLHLEKNFYIDFPLAALLLVLSALCWVAIGYWFDVYEKLDSAHPSVVLREGGTNSGATEIFQPWGDAVAEGQAAA